MDVPPVRLCHDTYGLDVEPDHDAPDDFIIASLKPDAITHIEFGHMAGRSGPREELDPCDNALVEFKEFVFGQIIDIDRVSHIIFFPLVGISCTASTTIAGCLSRRISLEPCIQNSPDSGGGAFADARNLGQRPGGRGEDPDHRAEVFHEPQREKRAHPGETLQDVQLTRAEFFGAISTAKGGDRRARFLLFSDHDEKVPRIFFGAGKNDRDLPDDLRGNERPPDGGWMHMGACPEGIPLDEKDGTEAVPLHPGQLPEESAIDEGDDEIPGGLALDRDRVVDDVVSALEVGHGERHALFPDKKH